MAMFLLGMVQWWEEWQLRVLALSSLFLQLFLFVSAAFRKYRIPAVLRSCIWLAYLGSDALAIYGLATLFNRHRKPSPADGHGSSSMLEVMWAPVFLIHLGGQDSITAYNIEDNELWARHAVAMSSQAAVAVYVFCRSWSLGKVPMRCPVALFVAGFLKLGDRLWALRRASLTRLAIVRSESRRRVTAAGEDQVDDSLEDYVRRAGEEATHNEHRGNYNDSENRREARRRRRRRRGQLLAANNLNELMELFIDFPAPYPRRLGNLRSFLPLRNHDAYYELCNLLDQSFQFFYTKKEAAYTVVGVYLRGLVFVLAVVAIAAFGEFDLVDKQMKGLDRDDVKVSYALLSSIVVLEFCDLVWLLDWQFVPSRMLAPEMQRTVAQFNLIGFASRSRWPTMVMRVSTLFGCKNYANKHWYVEHHSSTPRIVEFIRKDLKSGWVDLHSAAAYRRFNDRRGQWTLRREQYFGELGWSVTKLPFDKAVLVWHVATGICLHRTDISPATEHANERTAATCSMGISNYMMYLLLFKPDMLLPGTQQSLFAVGCREISHALRHQRQQEQLSERDLARWLFSVDEATTAAAEQGGEGGEGRHLADARRLARAMMELDADRRLRVIGGVWVEMICYSASRCRGFLHSKSMGVGGEFLTVVWLLLHRMGMEGLADKLQRPEITGDVQDAAV
uniref:DUF4220 domain-containing protein n=1 Tax=Oryza glumipatula TaxID=40148 RepID=A0A0D9YPU1_9ORYZ